MISKEEFAYRFEPRRRPYEDDPNWDIFLAEFSRSHPELDSYRNAFFLIENGIGDQVCVLGLLRAFREHFQAKNIIVIAQEKSRDLLRLFDTFDYAISKESLPDFISASSGRTFNVLHRPSKSFSNYGRLGPVFNAFAVPYVDQYKIGMGLPLSAPFAPPSTKKLSPGGVYSELGNKSVILFPYSNTWQSAPIKFWQRLADVLNAAGFEVWTNVLNKVASASSRQPASRSTESDPLCNTKALRCSLPELVNFADNSAGIISSVSGPAWLLANTRTLKTIIYEDCTFPAAWVRNAEQTELLSIYDIESLSKNFPTEAFHELVLSYVEESSWDKKIDSIVQKLSGQTP